MTSVTGTTPSATQPTARPTVGSSAGRAGGSATGPTAGPVAGPRRSPPRMGDEAVVVSATGVVSLLNYAYTLILLWLLPTREFAEVGSISALLLICGTISGAALPWVLAQEVLRSRDDRSRRRIAVTFCLFATVLQGAAAGLATCLIVVHYASGPVVAAAFCSVLLIFLAATAAGYFQGLQRFRLIAMLRVAEVVVKVGAGVGLVALGAGASGAVAGFALGAGLVAGVGLAYMAPDITWSWSALAGRSLWGSTQGLMAIQAGVAVLASMDVVIGSLVLGTAPALATYQAANILGRVPVFIGAALSIVIFPKMINGHGHPRVVIRDTVSLYLSLCVPITLVTATLPASVVGSLFPARYGDVGAILPWTAVAGLVMGAVNLTTTYFQAAGIYRRTASLLGLGVVLGVTLDVFGLEAHGIIGLAIAVAVGGAVVVGALMREIHRTWPGALRGTARTGLFVLAWCLPLIVLRHDLVVWSLWAVGCGLVFCLRGLLGVSPTVEGAAVSVRSRILHLGYEDPRRPGAGGGSVRTHEINRRLADRFEITVVCARYRGSRPRVEDGVRYVHVGVVGGDLVERLAYFAFLPWALLRYRSDLVVEDFGAPFSSVAVPWMTPRPVVGVVQWLFAEEKSRQYHLPFALVERAGVRAHRHLIAVSEDLGAVLEGRNPRAEVTVIANGLDAGAFERYDRPRSDIVYLGRLEIAQKGLDLLLHAYARIADSIGQDLILAGDGPDRDALVELAARLGIADRVRFAGRIPADHRFEWLAGADLVAMPSRYETFGMVAAEALAVATPVVAFDIPCLRALVDDEVGARVPAFEVEAFADALRSLATDRALRRLLGDTGPDRVTGFNWDDLAAYQSRVYRGLLAGGGPVTTGGSDGDGGPVPGDGGPVPGPGFDQPGPVPDGAPVPGGSGSSVVGLLAAQAEATPLATAVVDGEVGWTYGELHRAAASVTSALAGHGIGAGDAVGVCLPRSKEAIAAMIGVWRAGAVYVPLDPEYPVPRLQLMCGRAGVAMLIGTSPLLTQLDPSVAHLDLVGIDPTAARGLPSHPTPEEPGPEDAAYVLFTSGSSGQPKAVQVSHRSLTTVLQWIRSTLRPDELAVTATSISFSFDPFVLEVLGPLMVGGLVRAIPNALAIADMDTGATLLANTPSVLTELLRAGRLPPSLRTVIVGGEVLSESLAGDLLRGTSIDRLINTYGPTEATVLATAFEVSLPVSGPVPIGHELPGAGVVLLDEEEREVEGGRTGEICIFGPQLADGYLGDPRATAERFVEWTRPDGASVRIYRTGDMGRRGADGAIEFRGRRDRQIKLRGYRIEPGEIEATLRRHPGVDQAVVSATGGDGHVRLAAHVTTTTTAGSTPSDIRAWLQRSLPKFMIPAHVVVVDSFPMTPNGKVDIDRLPPWRPPPPAGAPAMPPAAAPDDGATGTGGGDAGPPGESVATVARLAARILGFDGPIRGEDDVLDDLGGSSLALFQLLTAIEEECASRIEIGRILEDTTIADLAALVGSTVSTPPFLSVHADGGKRPIFLIHAYLGTALRYRRLGPHLSPDRPLVGIQVQEFDGATGPTRTTVDQMAEEAVAQIRSLQPVGPYVLGGHSAGGLVAYEAARRLVHSGDGVPLVVLLDSPVPRSSLHYLWAELVLNWPDIRTATAAERRRQVRALLGRRLGRVRRTPDGDRVGAAISRSHRASNLAVKRYQPRDYAGDVAVIRTRQGTAMALGREDLGWGPLVGGRVFCSEVSGLHNTIFEPPQVEAVGRRIDELLDLVDGGWEPVDAAVGGAGSSPLTTS